MVKMCVLWHAKLNILLKHNWLVVIYGVSFVLILNDPQSFKNSDNTADFKNSVWRWLYYSEMSQDPEAKEILKEQLNLKHADKDLDCDLFKVLTCEFVCRDR